MSRARCDWLMDGDKNTSFFYKSVIVRRRRNRILNLKSEVGEEILFCDINAHIVNYFSSLFTSQTDQQIYLDISYTQTISIVHPPTLVEVHRAVFGIGDVKGPGNDGMHAHFFQSHWGIIWQDLLNFSQQCFASKSFPDDINSTTIFLISKNEHSDSIRKFRPISLCNTSYKIISKIIVNKVRPRLDFIISPNQNSFLPGRGCDTNYIAASEILHSMKSKKGKLGWFALKIDLEKAYDRLEWGPSVFCLAKNRFSQESCDLIMSCVSTSNTKVVINGRHSEPFHTSIGIRQGDPISPYIFIICMEYLSSLITQAHTQNKWKSFFLKRNGTPITHLIFADDLLLFGDTSPATLKGTVEVLYNFWDCSGQKMNTYKRRIYFTKHTLENQKQVLCSHLHIEASNDLGNYLGFPFTDKRLCKSQVDHIVRKMRGKLSKWKSEFLSKPGRWTLINYSLNTIANSPMNSQPS